MSRTSAVAFLERLAPESHLSGTGQPKRAEGVVRVHYNLHTGGYSIDAYRSGVGWRLAEDQVPTVLLENAYGQYMRSGLEKYLDTGVRNVHAWFFGSPTRPVFNDKDPNWRPARYSKAPACFVDIPSGLCLPNNGSIDIYMGTRPAPVTKGKKSKGLPVVFWRPGA